MKSRVYPQSSQRNSSVSRVLHYWGQKSQAEPHGVEDGNGGESLVSKDVLEKITPLSPNKRF